jgi:hypothetical protein
MRSSSSSSMQRPSETEEKWREGRSTPVMLQLLRLNDLAWLSVGWLLLTRFLMSSAAKLTTLSKAVLKVGKGVVTCGLAYWGEAQPEVVKVRRSPRWSR